MNDLKKLSDRELQARYRITEDTIYGVECFGTRDLVYLEMIGRELERRGYEAQENRETFWYKKGQEDEA